MLVRSTVASGSFDNHAFERMENGGNFDGALNLQEKIGTLFKEEEIYCFY